ncbi:MAG TPA: LacI family DNA-binding transcriptional regulator [Kiritimatiellia bacterium]|jgi:LacI family transcriptional regulator
MDVVRESGTSKATVSRVLNKRPGVVPELRERVLAAIKKLNYTPGAAARALSLSRSNTFGVVFQDITSGWLLNVFRGVMHVASGTGYNVVTCLSAVPGDELLLPGRLLAEGRVDGMVWYDPRVTPAMIDEIKQRQLPFVMIQKHVDDPEVNTVSIENIRGGYIAMKHLLDLGYRRIVLVTGGEDNEDSNQRLQGARQALSEFHLKPTSAPVVVGHHVGMHAIKAFSTFLEEGHRLPEAVFAFNDNMAVALVQWFRSKGHRVPEDVAVVGFDGTDDAEHIGLSTVVTPMYETGVLATQILLDVISNAVPAKKARQVLLSGHLVARDTCGAKLRAEPQRSKAK